MNTPHEIGPEEADLRARIFENGVYEFVSNMEKRFKEAREAKERGDLSLLIKEDAARALRKECDRLIGEFAQAEEFAPDYTFSALWHRLKTILAGYRDDIDKGLQGC